MEAGPGFLGVGQSWPWNAARGEVGPRYRHSSVPSLGKEGPWMLAGVSHCSSFLLP